jgi:hypothetical protein
MTHRYKVNPQDKQTGQAGKVENDTNKLGNENPTQKNEGRRTPKSRHDREDHIGNNQTKVRGGSPQGSSTHQPPSKGARGGNKRGM